MDDDDALFDYYQEREENTTQLAKDALEEQRDIASFWTAKEVDLFYDKTDSRSESTFRMETCNLKFLWIWDPAQDIQEAIAKDKELLSNYCENLKTQGYDIDYEAIPSTSISSYGTISKKCDNKTRIIIWYTGHGKNLNKEVISKKDNFPCFVGDKIFIEQHKLLEKLPRNILNVIIFDTCNNAAQHKNKPDVELNINSNFATLFDFEGDMLISSAKRNQSAFCRSSEGSTFTISFINKFYDTYDNTIQILTNYVSSSIISYGHLHYEKYVKDEEMQVKSNLITMRKERKLESDSLFRLMEEIDVQQYNSRLNKRKAFIEKDMEKQAGSPSQSMEQ
jgi:hypothetical protein